MRVSVPEVRVRRCNERSPAPDGDYVLYWMIANRRLHFNFSLDRALEWSRQLGKPLLILEALRCGYEWASVRMHRFVLQGMADNKAVASQAGVSYYPYVEPEAGAGSGLLETLAGQACVVVTDDFPCFFLPRMVAAASQRLPVCVEAVDSNGLYPMRATQRVFTKAFSFRIHLQKTLGSYLGELPVDAPLAGEDFPKADCIPKSVLERWPTASEALLAAEPQALAELSIDRSVGPAVLTGGEKAARARVDHFLSHHLQRYAEDRNQPDNDPSSGLSPYLHFGHISAHEVFVRLCAHESWGLHRLSTYQESKGKRHGWWDMSQAAEAFLDELVTWREIGYNACCHDPIYHRFESLPQFALDTLHLHASDPRPYLVPYETLRDAATDDEIWNAAQTQLVREGRMHNYLRMLWGKKILEWTESPQQALDIMIDLNNRYAVDGRNPNSYSGIFWTLGRYDRAWGPERPIFGKIRYMSSDSTRRKLKLKGYLAKYGSGIGGEPVQGRLF